MPSRPRSLRLRIALLYGALTGVAVALVAIAGFLVHRRAEYDAVDRSLRNSAEHMAAELSAARTPREIEEVLSSFIILGAGARVFDAEGAVIGQSKNGALAPSFKPCEVFSAADVKCAMAPPAAIPESPRRAGYHLLRDSVGVRWRVYALPIDNGARFFAAMLPLSDIDRSVAMFARWMIAIAIAGSAATTCIGWLIARRALRPVAVLTAGAMAQSRAFSRRAGDEKDRDELDRLASTFNEMLATLHNAYEAQRRFTAAASHELRSPLSIISANLEFLAQEHLMCAADRAETIAEAHGQAERMARLIANLLVLARADAGVPLARQAVELDRVLLEVVGELRHVVKAQRLEIVRFQPVIVQGDADRLKQLVLILLDNAIKYTAANQHVTVNLTEENAVAVLRVRDTGVGMSSSDLLGAFERFYRADNARAIDAGGTGLGLPIARLIAEEHGGTVELTSELGQGTTATVRIPVSGRATT